MRLTLKKVNEMIQQIESGWELVKGNGYFYWTHPTDSPLDNGSVHVYKLSDYTLEQWVAEFIDFINGEKETNLKYRFWGWSVSVDGSSAGSSFDRNGPFSFQSMMKTFSNSKIVEYMVFVPLIKKGTKDAYLDYAQNIKVKTKKN
ncbi:MAG: hypothetical protein CMC82_04985 [Flavobacteriaceae bacterium]|nr:hypothetical protein [Flavobacteriaceae bacterium]|tara:strand:- start:30 stop:464 length:435 start_codon:yes stop_codon:yes gene_type:complete